jgi:hypothetical protein
MPAYETVNAVYGTAVANASAGTSSAMSRLPCAGQGGDDSRPLLAVSLRDRFPDVDHAGSARNGRTSTFRLQCFDPSAASLSATSPKTGYVWVPAINIGSVNVVDTSNGSVREISGFATKELEVKGRKRAQGPSGVSIGDGAVYIGDRADSSVCAVDEKTLARKSCGHIDSSRAFGRAA